MDTTDIDADIKYFETKLAKIKHPEARKRTETQLQVLKEVREIYFIGKKK